MVFNCEPKPTQAFDTLHFIPHSGTPPPHEEPGKMYRRLSDLLSPPEVVGVITNNYCITFNIPIFIIIFGDYA